VTPVPIAKRIALHAKMKHSAKAAKMGFLLLVINYVRHHA